MTDYSKAFSSGALEAPKPDGEPRQPRYGLAFEDDRGRANLAMRSAAGTSPEAAAETMRLARRYGVPPQVTETLAEDYRARALADDGDAALAQSPRLRSWVASDPRRASLAQDDLGPLSAIETAIRTIKGAGLGLASSPWSASAGLWGFAAAPFEVAGQAQLGVNRALGIGSESNIALDFGGWLRKQQRVAEGGAANIYTPPEDAGVIERGIGSGFRSAGQTLMTLPLALLPGGQSAPLVAMGATTGGASYGKAREAGLSPAGAAVFGSVDAAAEVVTEKFALGKLLGDIKAGTGAAKMLVNNLVREIPGEMAATMWQSFNEWLMLNPDKPVREWVSSLPEQLAETVVATIAGGGAQIGAIKGAQKAMGAFDRRGAAAAGAETSATQMQELSKLSEAAKLKTRDAESFRELVAEIAEESGDAPTELHIDGQALVTVLNQSGVSREALEQMAPVVAAQLDAAATGAMVRIPVSEFLSAGEAVTAPLIDHLRTSPDAMSRAEAVEYLKGEEAARAAELETSVERAETFRAMAAPLQAKFEQQLAATKKYRPEVAKTLAQVPANYFATQAIRSGMSVEEFTKRYGLEVVARDKPLGEGAMSQKLQYQIDHKPMTKDAGAATLDDLASSFPEDVYGKDALRLYGSGDKREVAVLRQLQGLRGKPDAMVTVYRGVPVGVSAINPGDWVTLSKEVAADYGNVVSLQVPASHVTAWADSLLEFGYFPPGFDRTLDQSARIDPNDPSILNQSGDTPLAQIALPDSFDAGPALIALLEGANRSSFLHESAHFFLEVHGDMAKRIQAQMSAGASVADMERGIVQDMRTLLDWAGLKDSPEESALDQWSRLSLEERRDMHEQFARGFEAYTREGKAPSLELKSAFDKFRSWLMELYKTLRGLNVTLTDDVRAVMDRMLATDEAIAEAEAARNMGALFREPPKAGMTLEEYQKYQGQAQGATDAATAGLQARVMKDMKWLARARDRAMKEAEREAADRRRETRMEVRAEVYAEPLYRAWAFLTGKPGPGDKVAKGEKRRDESLLSAIARHGGLSQQGASDLGIAGDDRKRSVGVGLRIVRSTGGLDADRLAERLLEDGYLTPDDNGKHALSELEDKIAAEMRGNKQFPFSYDFGQDQQAQPTDADFGKLSTPVLREMYGTKEDAVWRKLSARRMTNDTGIDPDVLAATIMTEDGPAFDSGDALVRALAEALPPNEVIEARTDERMMEKYGDITSPEALAQAADEAVHNELRARVLASELRALQEATKVKEKAPGRKASTDVLRAAAKQYAEQIVARLKVRDIKPGQYTAAAARSGRLAEKAFGEAKTAEAAMHKRNQLVNHYAARAAFDARDEVAAAVKYLRKFDKPIKSIDSGYQDQIDQLLEGFDLKDATNREVDRRRALGEWVAEQQALGAVPDITPEMMAKVGRQSYKDMTLEEMRGLVDSVKEIEHLGRLKQKLLLARDKREFDDVVAEMAASIITHGGKARRLAADPTQRSRAGDLADAFFASQRKLSSYFHQMDGLQDNGPMWERVGRPMNERGDFEETEKAKATVSILGILAPLMKLRGGIGGFRSKVEIPGLGSVTRGYRLSVVLNMGNEANRQRLRSTITDEQVAAIVETLTPQELQAVNDIWAFVDGYWPQIAEKQERVTGVAPEKVEATPFVLTASDGTEVPMRGGYYPIAYDADVDPRMGNLKAEQIEALMARGAAAHATTARGHVEARDAVVDKPLRLELEVLTRHIDQVIHDLAWHEWLIDTGRILRNEDVSHAINDHYGHRVLESIKDGVTAIAVGNARAADSGDRIMSWARRNVSRSVMAFSFTTAFLQPFGLTQSMARIGVGPVLKGIGRWMGDAVQCENTLAWIKEKSPAMRERATTMNRELYEINKQMAGQTKAGKLFDWSMFLMMRKLQLIADIPTWIGQYEKTLAEEMDKAKAEGRAGQEAIDAAEASAVAQADRVVVEAQGGGHIKDLTGFQRDHPNLTMFFSYFSATANLVSESTAKTDFKSPAAVAGWLGDMMLLVVIPAIGPALLMHAMKGGFAGDDDDEGMVKRLMKWQAGYLASMLPFVREVSGMIEGFDYQGPAVGRLFAASQKLSKQVQQGEADEAAIKAAVGVLGPLLGLPTVQLLRSWHGWKAWADDQPGATAASLLLGPPPKKD